MGKSLKIINLRDNKIEEIKENSFEECKSLVKLSISKNFLSSLPPINSNHLICLNLDHNQISDVSLISKFSNLAQLNLNSNKIGKLPNLEGLTKLKILSFDQNLIRELPANISLIKKLKFLSGNDNLMTSLPVDLIQLANCFRFVSFKGNKFDPPIPDHISSNYHLLLAEIKKIHSL